MKGVVKLNSEDIDPADVPKEMKQRLKAELPDYMIPKKIEIAEEMPLTNNGKPDRKRINEVYQSWSHTVAFTFFAIALIVLLPVIILGLLGKRSKAYNLISTLIMIVVIFADDQHNFFGIKYLSYHLLSLVLYIIWQALIIKGFERLRANKRSTPLYITTMILSILPLFMVKLLQSSWLGSGQLHLHSSKIVELFGFLGISYIMFKSVQLIMEIHDGTLKQTVDLKKLVQFITFFPTISSGPIDRYRRFVKDYDKEIAMDKYSQLLGKAIHYIMIGLLYKYIIAHFVQQYFVTPYTGHLESFGDYVIYMYGYSFYLFWLCRLQLIRHCIELLVWYWNTDQL